MKPVVIVALISFFAGGTVSSAVAQAPQFPAAAHISALRPRLTATGARWRTTGDVFANSPAEWTDCLNKANAFRANPTRSGTKVGSVADRAFHLWRGYPSATGIDPAVTPQQYPTYEGEGQIAAAMLFALTGDVTYGNAVREALLAQVRLRAQGGTAGFVGAYADELPTPPLSNTTGRPTSFSFSNEAVWIDKLGQAFALCRSRFSVAEQNEFTAWHNAWADYLALVMSARFTSQGIPGYLNLNMAGRSGIYADNFPADKEMLYYTQAGQAGPLMMGSGQVFGNVYASFVGALGANYLVSGRLSTLQAIRAWYNAWLFFAVYPDGTTAESVRNGDYRNPARGAIWYQRIVVETLCKVELMIRQRKATMLDITQTGGQPLTRVPVGGQPKSLQLVLDRALTYYTGSDMRYSSLTRNLATRIYSPYIGSPASEYGDDFETGPASVFGMAFQIYGIEAYRRASRHNVEGMQPLPAKGYSSARGVQSWFNGTGNDIYPGVYSVWSNLDVRQAYVR